MTSHAARCRGQVRRRWWLGLALLLATSAGGCVLRTLQVRSSPSGARVFLDDTEVGTTPCDLPFDHYGTRRIRLAKDGHVTHEGDVHLSVPWYEWFPIDFVSEVLWPGTIHDVHTYSAGLEPLPTGVAAQQATADLLARAEAARAAGRLPDDDAAPSATPPK